VRIAAKIARLFDGGAGRHLEVGAHFVGEDVRERGLAQTGRAVEQHMVDGVAALARRLDENLHLVAQPRLPDHLAQRTRAQCVIDLLIACLWCGADGAAFGVGFGNGCAASGAAFVGHGQSVHLF
jgi:hypothetical protein